MTEQNQNNKSEKKAEIPLPSVSEEKPLKNFLILLILIPIAPILLLYSLITNRKQHPFIFGSSLAVAVSLIAFIFYFLFGQQEGLNISDKKMAYITMIDEFTPQEKEEMRGRFSTLRQSIGEEKLPKTLEPVYDLPVDMLTINYFYFLIQAGHMGENGEGAVYILERYLYSGKRELAEPAWQALLKINTQQSQHVMTLFAERIEEAKKQKSKNKEIKKVMPKGFFEGYKQDIQNKMQIYKNRMEGDYYYR